VRVSVVIPCYNAAPYIAEAIRSTLTQTRVPDEVIVVDDGSSDGSGDIAESFGAPVRVIRQQNRGENAARNRGLDAARGNVIAFLDSDDFWFPPKLERQLDYLAMHPEVGAVAAGAVAWENDRATRTFPADDVFLRDLSPIEVLALPLVPVMPSTLVARAEHALAIRFPLVKDGGDLMYTSLLRMRSPIGGVEEVLAAYRKHPTQRTKSREYWVSRVRHQAEFARAHFAELGSKTPEDAEMAVLRCAAEEAMQLYWERDVEQFRFRRRTLLALWPKGAPIPYTLSRPVLPRAVLRFKDAVDRMLDI
jgi:glycosyltransferase involved in cell wall biosynthesis